MEQKTVTPFVYWAQSDSQLFLRIELEAKGTPEVTTTAKRFEFACKGIAPGLGARDYQVSVDLHDEIVAGNEGFRMEIGGSRIQFFIQKAPEHFGFWPNLLAGRAKPAWLKIDFDRFQSGDADSEEDKKPDENGEDRSMRETVDNLLRDVKRSSDSSGFSSIDSLDFKKFYLTIYNVFMFFGFLNVFLTILKNYFFDEISMFFAYEQVGFFVRWLQYFQALEVVHAAVGLVRSAPLSAGLQAIGRLVVLHIIHFQPLLQKSSLVFWLFLAWSSIELIRYPFYLCQIHGVVPFSLKFLRYTSWIVLYPFGMIIETLIIVRALETYHQSHPAPLLEIAGMELTVVRLIGVYACLLPFAFIFLLRHMFFQTKSQLFNKKKTVKNNRSKKIK